MAAKIDKKTSVQRDRFAQVARTLGAELDEAAFKAKLVQIARPPVPQDAPTPKGPKKGAKPD
jgi:hypothetical protein